MLITFDMAFSGSGFGDAELVIGLPRKNREQRKGMYRDKYISKVHSYSRYLLHVWSPLDTPLGTWNTSVNKGSLLSCSGGVE